MRNSHGEGRTQAAPRQEAVESVGSCKLPILLFYHDFVDLVILQPNATIATLLLRHSGGRMTRARLFAMR